MSLVYRAFECRICGRWYIALEDDQGRHPVPGPDWVHGPVRAPGRHPLGWPNMQERCRSRWVAETEAARLQLDKYRRRTAQMA